MDYILLRARGLFSEYTHTRSTNKVGIAAEREVLSFVVVNVVVAVVMNESSACMGDMRVCACMRTN